MADASAAAPKGPPKATATPAVRRTVVLRPGPPPRKGRWADMVSAVLGLLLLVASVVMANTMWVPDVLPPQFEVKYASETTDLPAQTRYFNDTLEEHEFVFQVPVDNVYEIVVSVHFEDDLVASDPERFRVGLLDQTRALVGVEEIIQNDPPTRNATNPSEYEPIRKTKVFRYSVVPKPEDTVIDAHANATASSVSQEAERLVRVATKGNWTFRVQLLFAGDCPQATPGNANPDTVLRGAACLRANAGQGTDPRLDRGNPFTVGSFSYTRFTVSAEQLE